MQVPVRSRRHRCAVCVGVMARGMNTSLPAVEAALACVHEGCNAARDGHLVVGQGEGEKTNQLHFKEKVEKHARLLRQPRGAAVPGNNL